MAIFQLKYAARFLAVAVLLLGIVGSLAGFILLERAETTRIRERFHADVSAIVASFERELRLGFEALHAVGSAFISNPQAEQAVFAQVVGNVLQRQPVLRGATWAAWDATARQLNPQRCFALPSELVTACQAPTSDQHNSQVALALTTALEQLSIQVSTAFPLTLDASHTQALKRFWAFLPVTSMVDGKVRLWGVVAGEFMVGDLFAHSLAVAGMQDVQVDLIDETAPLEARVIFRKDPGAVEGTGPNYRYTLALPDVGGRAWRVEAKPTRAYIAARRSQVAKFTLVAGLMLSGLLFAFVWSLINRARTVEVLVNKRTAELDQANRRLEQLARIDTLTGLPNRRAFDEALAQEFKRSLRSRTALALFMLDVDYFKRYNDTYGHVAGDACLQAVAAAIANTFKRAGDFAARYGGEEFAAVLPTTDERVLGAAERCLDNIRALNIEHRASDVAQQVTASIGVCIMKPPASNLADVQALLRAADAALYQAKQQGRNCVVLTVI